MDMPVRTAPAFAVAEPPPAAALPMAQLARLLRRRAWLVGVCAVLGAVGAYAYAATVPKSFTASSLVAVEGDRFAIPELQGALRSENAPDPMPWVRTEVQAITSRDLVKRVVDRLKLAELPEFNAELQPPSLVAGIKDYVQSLLPRAPVPAGPATTDAAVLNAVTRALAVFQDNRSLVIELSFTSRDPALSAAVVNAVIAEYVASRAKRRVSANLGANTAMTERIDQVRTDLADIERKMRELRNGSEMVNLRAGSSGQQQLEELTTAATRASVERAELQTQFDRATSLSTQGSSDALASVLGSATISRLREQEGTASRRVAELAIRYGTGHPGAQSAQAELSSVRQQMRAETQRIVASVGSQLRVAREREADLLRQTEEARRTGLKAENARAQLDQLQQEAVTRRAMYQTLMERAQQTVVQPSGTETPDVRVVSQAAAPLSPSSPNMKLAAGSGGLAGLVLGCLLALIGAGRADPRTAMSTLAATGMPVAATFRRDALRAGPGGLAARVASDPAGLEAGTLRDLRAHLLRLGQQTVPRSVAVIGVGAAGLGPAVAAALARVAALDGDRVLLVEGDLQRPQLAGVFGERDGKLLLVLDGLADWRESTNPDPHSPLDLLCTAGPGPRPAPNGPHFQNLVLEAAEQYDLTVLAAPDAASPAASSLAESADATLLVADMTALPAAQSAFRRLGSQSRNPVLLAMVGP